MAGRMIPKNLLEEIRFRNDIVEVIGSYFHLQRSGSAFKSTCPFHKEKTPSFHVNPQRQIFHCFGCGAGGDVFKFVMQYEGMDFTGAARMLADRAGIRLELEEGDSAAAGEKDALYRIHEELAAYYHKLLLEAREAAAGREYLAKRSLPDTVIRDFLIGYAPDRWDTAVQWALKQKYRLEQLETAGLVLKAEKPGGRLPYYDRFRNRVMFPIRNEQGRVIGFSGRALVTDDRTAKYVNSPETPLFRKSHVLYALDRARKSIVEAREALVCEGQIDVIRCHQAGFTTAVAAQGTAFTEDHARILRRYADSILLMFDSDDAGRNASVRASGVFMQSGLAVRVASLPAREDPDSFILRNGADAFRTILTSAAPAIEFLLTELLRKEDIRTEAGSIRVYKAVLAWIAQSPNPLHRADLVQRAAARLLNRSADDLMTELNRTLKGSGPRERAEPTPAPKPAPLEDKPPAEERALAEDLAAHPELAGLVERYLPLDQLRSLRCRRLIEAVLTAQREGRHLQDVLASLDDGRLGLVTFAAELLSSPAKSSGNEFLPDSAVKDLILTIWRREWTRRRSDLAAAPSGEGTAVAEQRSQLTRELNLLRRWDTGVVVIEMQLP